MDAWGWHRPSNVLNGSALLLAGPAVMSVLLKLTGLRLCYASMQVPHG